MADCLHLRAYYNVTYTHSELNCFYAEIVYTPMLILEIIDAQKYSFMYRVFEKLFIFYVEFN